MQPIAATRRELFPDTFDDGHLEAARPPRLPFSGRAWYRFILGCVALGICIIVFDRIAAHTAPDAINAFLGGTGVKIDVDDGDVHVIDGTWLAHLMYASFAIAGIVYCLLRLAIVATRSPRRRQSWRNYAAQRGLTPVAAGMSSTQLPVFNDGRDRHWTGLHAGRLRGDHVVTVGATAWTTGSGKSQERHHLFFAHVRLSREVAEVFPGTSLTRFLRGIIDVDLHPWNYEELRFESIAVDNACEIRVKGDPDDVRWRELFEPNTLVGLDELYDGQWQHVGSDIVFVAGGNRHSAAPVDVLDGLCLTAAFMLERFRWAALGDVPRDRLAG